jgi:hypothetical protein
MPGQPVPVPVVTYNTRTSQRFISFLADQLPALIAFFVFVVVSLTFFVPMEAELFAVYWTILLVYGAQVYWEGTHGLSFGRFFTHTRLVRVDNFEPPGLIVAGARACSFCLWCWMPMQFPPLLGLWDIGVLVFWISILVNLFMVPITGQTLQDKIFKTVVIFRQ